MVDISKLSTEQQNMSSSQIDRLDTVGMLSLINEEDHKVAPAVKEVIPAIAHAVDEMHKRRKQGGRIFYIGAGSSGRMGVLDAAECPPTYGTHPEDIVGIMAGGAGAMFVAVEGAEDDTEQGAIDLQTHKLTHLDTVIGIAASGRTPYVIGALDYAKSIGAYTVGLSSVEGSAIAKLADIAITPVAGPEVITGSTRMKSGTAQKLVLNMISTSLMIKEGKVYGNLMVDLKATNEKLVERSKGILSNIIGVTKDEAKVLLDHADMHVKTAVVMFWLNLSAEEAKKALEDVEGQLSRLAPDYSQKIK